MASNNLRELAKQGDPKVISSIINHSLQKKGINVQVTRDNDCLEVSLESNQVSNQQAALVEFIRTGIVKLGVESINTVKIYGFQTGEPTPAWEDEILLGMPPTPPMPDLKEVPEEEDFPENIDELDGEVGADYETETDEEYYDEAEYDEVAEYEENEEYEEDEDESHPTQPQKKKTTIILAILLLVILVPVAALAALHFSGIYVLPFLSQSKSESTEASNTGSSTSEPQTSESPKTTESATTVPNPWYWGVKSAQTAAQKGQTAKTKSEWNVVVNEWQKAVDFMKEVPESNPNYEKAQAKITEYQKNLDIVKQRASQAPN